MIKFAIAAALAAITLPAAAGATEPAKTAAQAPAAKQAYTTADTDIGTLLDDPAAKAIVEKYIPGLTTNPQVDMARAMTLKAVQAYAPDEVTDERLAKIDADLAKLK
ncbi:MAG TPA: hypothetical protein VN627_06265 [Novosphingobium sp.]|nr:hypothetical protein [Novosphingobium sp.]